jgi:hypothetical protein
MREMLADDVDDLLKRPVEFEGPRDEAMVGIRHSDSRLGSTCDHDGVMWSQLDDDGIPSVGISSDMNAADASY